MTRNPVAPPARWAAIRGLAPLFAVYGFLALLQIRLKLLVTPAWFDATLDANHKALLAFEYTNNEQSRILQFYIPEAFVRVLGVTVPHAYMVQRWLFVAASYVIFHLYLRKWFTTGACVGAVCLLAAILPFSFINDLQESSPFLMVSTAAALWVLRDGRPWAFAAVLLIAAMNNETSLSLLAVFAVYRFTGSNLRALWKLAWHTAAVAAPAFLFTAWIRWITRDAPHLGGAWHWRDNVRGIRRALRMNPFDYFRAEYLFVFFIFNVLWIYAYVKAAHKPRFVRATLWLVPAFILPHMITGIISEPRQMIPLGFVVIPASLFWLLRPEDKTPAGAGDT